MTDDGASGTVQSGPKFMSKADMDRKLMKRFYKEVSIVPVGEQYAIELDGRRIKTPQKAELLVFNKAIALDIAEEWRAQEEFIDPETMLLTKLANTSLDRVQGREGEIIEEIASYLGSDLLCYRSDSPAELLEREQKAWDPVLSRLSEKYGITLNTASGIIHAEQPAASIEAARKHMEGYSIHTLCALHNITTILGSGALAISLAERLLDMESAWKVAHVDEDWQIEKWGEDEEAKRRRELRHQEVVATARYMEFSLSSR